MGFAGAIDNSSGALNAVDKGMSVVSNNMANINTDGFKGSRVLFGDVLNSVLGQTSPDDIGNGVDVQAVMTQFADGTIQNTNNPLDFAISGDGFFKVQDTSRNEMFYTRAGAFSLDKSSNIVDANGDILQGYLADASGNVGTTLASLNLNGALTSPAQATANAKLSVNLNPEDTIPANPWLVAPLTGPAAGSYNYSTG